MLGSVFASVAVLVVGWQAGSTALTHNSSTSSTSLPAASGTASNATTPSTTTDGSATATPDTSSSASSDGTFTGSSVSTRYGDVQVEVTVASGQISDVTALRLTDKDGRSVQISNRAAPVLREEVLAAQSADVSNVSGATYTTDAYLTSLQSALDKAGL